MGMIILNEYIFMSIQQKQQEMEAVYEQKRESVNNLRQRGKEITVIINYFVTIILVGNV